MELLLPDHYFSLNTYCASSLSYLLEENLINFFVHIHGIIVPSEIVRSNNPQNKYRWSQLACIRTEVLINGTNINLAKGEEKVPIINS